MEEEYYMKWFIFGQYCSFYVNRHLQLFGRDLLILPVPIRLKNQSKLVRYMEVVKKHKLKYITSGYFYFQI